MGSAYKLECRKCGAHFLYSEDSSYGVLPTCIGCGDGDIRPSIAKCPACQCRISTSSDEFREQIIEQIG